jgi:hypothetical protein
MIADTHCQEKNEFPEWSKIDVFICEFCGEPVEVEDWVR